MKGSFTNQATRGNARGTMVMSGVTLAWIVIIGIWEPSGADRWILQHLANSRGFTLREDWWLRVLLHEDLRLLSQLAFALLAVLTWKPLGFMRELSLPERIGMLVGVTASVLAVSAIKYFSLTSCPWDLSQFGGVARYVSHWDWGTGDGGPGHCFPSGHATAGFAFLPLALPALRSGQQRQQRLGWRILLAAVLFGTICGIAQVLRGAHYPSHVLWSGFICWTVAMISYELTRFAAAQNSKPLYT